MRVRESFGRQQHMTTLGVTIERVAPGEVDLGFPYDPRFCQQNGFMHAGAVASVADSANGYAAGYSLAPVETDVLAVEFKINLVAPARGSDSWACGRVLRAGRTLTVCQADVFGGRGGSGRSWRSCCRRSSCGEAGRWRRGVTLSEGLAQGDDAPRSLGVRNPFQVVRVAILLIA